MLHSSCYTFAFDGSSTAASHTAPPVFPYADSKARLSSGCDCSVYPDVPSGYSLVRSFSAAHRGESPNSRKLVLAQELFNCRQNTELIVGKKEESSPDECENLKNSLDNLSKICYNKHIVGTRKKVVRELALSSDRLCVHTHTGSGVFCFTRMHYTTCLGYCQYPFENFFPNMPKSRDKRLFLFLRKLCYIYPLSRCDMQHTNQISSPKRNCDTYIRTPYIKAAGQKLRCFLCINALCLWGAVLCCRTALGLRVSAVATSRYSQSEPCLQNCQGLQRSFLLTWKIAN